MNLRILHLLWPILAILSSFNCLAAEKGDPVPNCALHEFVKAEIKPQTLQLQELKGQVLYVDFWASWCGPCLDSFPFMNKLSRDYKDKDLQVLAINLDEEADDAQAFLQRFSSHFKVLADQQQQCAKDFAVKAMPSTYLIDRQGVIRHVHLGFRVGEAEQLRVLVEKLLHE